MTCDHEPTQHIAPIYEGICPRCSVALDREADCGRCPCCRMGFSAQGNTVSIHAFVEVPAHPHRGRLRQ